MWAIEPELVHELLIAAAPGKEKKIPHVGMHGKIGWNSRADITLVMNWSMRDRWPIGTPTETRPPVCTGKSLRPGTGKAERPGRLGCRMRLPHQ